MIFSGTHCVYRILLYKGEFMYTDYSIIQSTYENRGARGKINAIDPHTNGTRKPGRPGAVPTCPGFRKCTVLPNYKPNVGVTVVAF